MSDYSPVSCELQDYLEDAATLKKECRLTYLDENNKLSQVQSQIVDIYAADGADWCKSDDDTIIRLDQIKEFDTELGLRIKIRSSTIPSKQWLEEK